MGERLFKDTHYPMPLMLKGGKGESQKKISKYCISTMRKTDNLKFILRSGKSGKFSERKKWKTGYSLFLQAKENNVKMPILFSAAEEDSGIIYFAFIESVNIQENETNVPETTYFFYNLTEIKDAKPLRSLILRSTGKPLSDKYIRPYAVCFTPEFLINWGQEKGLDPIEMYRKNGSEKFHKNGKELNFSLLNFWQWYASGIVGNTLRGILAEFIVAQALNLTHTLRSEWDAYDLLLPNGVKIEIKSAAYIQSWFQKEPSKISFDIHKTKEMDNQTNQLADELKRQADIYVFCLLKHRNKNTIDPLNMDQWDFFILPRSVLDTEVGDQKRISLNSLKKLNPLSAKYENISSCINKLAENIEIYSSITPS